MFKSEKYISIFGHFYQPPRYNPWTLNIDLDISAKPFHDWNDKVTFESYQANAYARLKDNEDFIENIINNYEKISFSFGPLLLSWIKENKRFLYNAIIEADKKSAEKFSGHGNAIAQPYAHIIMPLANKKDREVDIYWGIKYFEKNFERYPEGFWLPEAAVDNLTLEILSDYGIKFVLLSPHQAKSIKLNDEWINVNENNLNTRIPYKAILPSGKSIGIIFYNRFLSGQVAFGELLKSGEFLARKLLESFENKNYPQLVSIATDGETYGHHKPKGETELAKALTTLETSGAIVTNLSYFYSNNPPTTEVQINENTSWSCPHGIERWRSNCGCASDIRPGWNQEWRTPLRKAIDYLRDNVESTLNKLGPIYSNDINSAILNYERVIFDNNPENVSDFINEFSIKDFKESNIINLLKLMELERNSILMQSSDGWFFEDIYRPEPIENLRFAKRVLQLLQELENKDLEEDFLNILKDAKSNDNRIGNGKDIYNREVLSSVMNAEKIGSSYAMRLLFENIAKENDYYSYRIILGPYKLFELGRARVLIGISTIISKITWRSTPVLFISLYYGWYNIYAGTKILVDQSMYMELEKKVDELIGKGMLPDIIDLIHKEFYPNYYNLNNLMKDDQKFIVNNILESAIIELSRHYDNLYNSYLPIMEYVRALELDYPKVFELLLQYQLEKILIEILENQVVDFNRLDYIIQWAKNLEVKIDYLVTKLLTEKIENNIKYLIKDPLNISYIYSLEKLLDSYYQLGNPIDNLWEAQNLFIYLRNSILRSSMPNMDKSILDHYKLISRNLKIKFP
ncbi:MAG: hypothetical protein C0171_05685 [Caldisphaera sp.]|nr:MAG: hypothetical protein C0171_05685 [Caldisphaera sp.]